MECEQIRAALSARLAGEEAEIPDEIVDAHMSVCVSCQQWYERAVRLNSALSPESTSGLAPGRPLEDLSERILVSLEPQRRQRERSWRLLAGAARAVMIVLAVAWIGWGIATLVDVASLVLAGPELPETLPAPGSDSGLAATVDPAHTAAQLAAQLAAIRLALGVGLLWASWRPRAAMGMAPVYGAIATFSIGFGIRDAIVGAQGLGEFLGLVLMAVSALALTMVWLGGYTPAALAQAWRAASGLPVKGIPPR